MLRRRGGGRGGRGRTAGGAARLLDSVREARSLALREVRALERPPGTPGRVEIGTALAEGEVPVALVAASSDGADLTGWGQLARLLASGEPPATLLIAAPAFLPRTRRAAARIAAQGTAVQLASLPSLAAGEPDCVAIESLPDAPLASRAGPERSLLERTLRVIEGAAALAGAGEAREIPGGFALYMRGVPVLRAAARGEGLSVFLLAPDRREIQIGVSSFPRWGVELHEMVLSLAQDPRLLSAAEAARDAAAERLAADAGVRLTARALAWSPDASRPIDWVGVDPGGRPALGVVGRAFDVVDVPAVLAALDVFEDDPARWAPGASGRPRLILAAERVESRAKSLLVALGIDVQVRAGEPLEQAVAPLTVAEEPREERRGRRRGRRRRRGRGEGLAAGGVELERGARPEPMEEEAEEREAEEREPRFARAEADEERMEAAPEEEAPFEEEREPEPEDEWDRFAAAAEAAQHEREEDQEPERVAAAADLEERPEEEEEEEGEGEEEPRAPLEVRARDEEAEPREEVRRRLRRSRAAIVVNDDPDAIIAGLVFARERRNVAQFWVCGQDALMDWFKTGATDLADNTDVSLVGFTAQPVPNEVIATAGLYGGRIQWFDHHEWPIEDLERLREAIGRDAIEIVPNGATPLAAVAAVCERRSRFTDKLVDLSGRRLSENDMARWGYRLVSLMRRFAEQPGDHRAAIQPIVTGKPSELPGAGDVYGKERAWLETHDPRVVYFGDYGMVVVHVPEGLDAGEIARRLRLQTGARLSLASREGDEVVALGCNEERRHVNAVGLVEQIADRILWAHALATADRLGRLRIEDLARHPERLELLIGEIVRHKSVLYG